MMKPFWVTAPACLEITALLPIYGQTTSGRRPLAVAWIAPTRGALRRFCVRLGVLSVVSGLCFWLLPIVSPPRAWDASEGGITARLLSWELGRADFGAVSFPSFHVFWAMLIASVVAERGPGWRLAGCAWLLAMSVACVLNGAHAVLDVASSWVIWSVISWVVIRRKRLWVRAWD